MMNVITWFLVLSCFLKPMLSSLKQYCIARINLYNISYGINNSSAHHRTFLIFFIFLINLRIVPISNIYQYFPKQKGLFSGIILCGIGAGTLISSFVAQQAINPNNEQAKSFNENEQYFDENIALNFPFGLRVLSIYFLLIAVFSTILIFPHNKEEENTHREIEFSSIKQTTTL